jgi:TnsA endonuclease N terminal
MVISRLTTKNRRPKQNIGNFSSCKMETSFRYNSLLQKDFMYWLEFDADVLSYGTPGIVVNYQSNGKEKSHTPDFQVVRYQKKQIIEVKSQKTVKSEKYDRLYQMLSGLYDETGWTFVVLTEAEIRREPILSNIKLLYGYARESFSIDEYRYCWEIARSNAPASLLDIFQILDQQRIRRNVLFKLLFHNLVELDIQQPITANSSIVSVAAKIDWRILFNG